MSLFPLPEAAAVVQESRLRPEQVDASFADAAALVTETAARIVKKSQIVETKVLRFSTKSDWGDGSVWAVDDKARRESLALQATTLFTLASLYGSAGQLNSRYWERANAYRQEAADILLALTDDLEAARAAAEGVDAATRRGRNSTAVSVQNVF